MKIQCSQNKKKKKKNQGKKKSKIKFSFLRALYCPKWELMYGNIYNLEVSVQMNKGSDLGCRETWYDN